MKRNHIIAAFVLFLLPVVAGAQVLKGSYFLENSVNRHKMNPAFAPRANYFQLPVIGNTGFGLYSNLALPTFMYPTGGKLGTFLHPSVSVKEFKKDMPKHPHLDMDFNTTILSFGWYTRQKSFWNVTVDTRVMMDVDLPSDLFVMLKKGVGTNGEKFNIGNMNAYATAGLQASIGYSRNIIKGLRAGVKLRAIAPLAYAGVNLKEVSLSTSADQWTINTEGYAYTAVQGLSVTKAQDAATPEVEFDLGKMLSNKVLAGFGYSIDLGAEYRLPIGKVLDEIIFSAAVTDLGQIFYKKNAVSAFKTNGSVPWVGFQEVSLESEVAFEEAVDDLMDGLKGLANYESMEHPQKFERSTMPRFYIGVEAPVLNHLMSVGFLYSSRVSHSYARHELTLSYNLEPCRWFALGLNYSFINTARTMGAMMEFTPKIGPTLYLGMDYFPMEFVNAPLLEGMLGEAPALLNGLGFESWFLPTSSRLNFNFGIAFNLGSKHVNPKKNKK